LLRKDEEERKTGHRDERVKQWHLKREERVVFEWAYDKTRHRGCEGPGILADGKRPKVSASSSRELPLLCLSSASQLLRFHSTGILAILRNVWNVEEYK
jgi:hypothetical protein